MKKTYFWFMLAIIFCLGISSGCSQKEEQTKQEQNSSAAEEETRKYNIPNVVGCSIKEAKELLDKNAIRYEIRSGGYNKKYDSGIICEQSVTGESDIALVTLKQSLGLEYTIENFQGQKYEKVKNKLKLFKKNLVYTYSTRYQKGVVISSDFIGGTFHKGESGTVTISNGRYGKKKVKGNNVEIAKKQFPGAKFKVKYKFSTARRGKVLSYSVGKSKKKSSVPVKLVVSDGMAVKVPDVTDRAESDAINILSNKGISYNVEYTYNDIESDPASDEGKVYFQSKEGKMKKSKTVTLAVSKPAIIISEMNMKFDVVGGVDTRISFANTTDKTISSVRFGVAYYDRVGEKADTDMELKYVGPLYAYQEEMTEWLAVIYNNATAAIKPLYADIKFMGGGDQRITFTGTFWHTNEYAG